MVRSLIEVGRLVEAPARTVTRLNGEDFVGEELTKVFERWDSERK